MYKQTLSYDNSPSRNITDEALFYQSVKISIPPGPFCPYAPLCV